MKALLSQYVTLCKPKVVALMILTAWAGMYLATEHSLPLSLWLAATVGITLMSTSAATINHIMDKKIDAIMERTQHRPLPTGKLSVKAAWSFAILQGVLGFLILYLAVNPLTAFLTFCSGIGYAVVYTLYLKHATPQNIVIGGLAGAMPPLLGWTAVTGQMDAEGWLLALIIFTWTPAHFWALSLYRYEDYRKATIPMLPVTHGITFTKLNILLYSLLTIAASLMPFAIGMSGWVYLISALLLDVGLMGYAIKLHFSDDKRIALKTFHYSLIYLTVLFIMILIDHYIALT